MPGPRWLCGNSSPASCSHLLGPPLQHVARGAHTGGDLLSPLVLLLLLLLLLGRQRPGSLLVLLLRLVRVLVRQAIPRRLLLKWLLLPRLSTLLLVLLVLLVLHKQWGRWAGAPVDNAHGRVGGLAQHTLVLLVLLEGCRSCRRLSGGRAE